MAFTEVKYCGRTVELCSKCLWLKSRHRGGVCPKKQQGGMHDVEAHARHVRRQSAYAKRCWAKINTHLEQEGFNGNQRGVIRTVIFEYLK